MLIVLSKTYDYFFNKFNRLSYNDENGPLRVNTKASFHPQMQAGMVTKLT